VSSITSTDPDVGQDWLYVHSPSTSALAAVDHNASNATGKKISQRLELESMTRMFHPIHKHLLVLVLVVANHNLSLISKTKMVVV
jgi:hypothetical protein